MISLMTVIIFTTISSFNSGSTLLKSKPSPVTANEVSHKIKDGKVLEIGHGHDNLSHHFTIHNQLHISFNTSDFCI
jgi:hypothetical protein